MSETVYVISLDLPARRRIVDALAGEPVVVKSYDDAVQFLNEVETAASGCVLAPVDLAGMGLPALIKEIQLRQLPLAVVVIGRDAEFALAIELVRAGAFDFLEHPFSDPRLRSVIRKAIGTGGDE